MGFLGRLEAIMAPTSGKSRKSPPPNSPAIERSAPQLLGTCAERASRHSGTLATNMTTERPASDQAKRDARRRLIALPDLLVDGATTRREQAAWSPSLPTRGRCRGLRDRSRRVALLRMLRGSSPRRIYRGRRACL